MPAKADSQPADARVISTWKVALKTIDEADLHDPFVENGAKSLLMWGPCRRQLVDLSDDMATKIDIQFYSDARDAVLKAIAE